MGNKIIQFNSSNRICMGNKIIQFRVINNLDIYENKFIENSLLIFFYLLIIYFIVFNFN